MKFTLNRNRKLIILLIFLFFFTSVFAFSKYQDIKHFVLRVAGHMLDSGPTMVKIPGKGYKIGKFEVTQKEWIEVMGSNPSKFKTCGDSCPVENISWIDAQKFIKKLNIKTGGHFRMPTSEEWEFACNGGKKYMYCGSDDLDSVAWFGKAYLRDDKPGNSGEKSHPVGLKKANGYGLYDMTGNVYEWTSDISRGEKNLRVIRGGSWNGNFVDAETQYISSGSIHVRLSYFGFRLAESNDPSKETAELNSVSENDEKADELANKPAVVNPSIYSTERIEAGDVQGDDEIEGSWRLIANLEGEVEFKGPSAGVMRVEKEVDLNGDGVTDALVVASSGGNCCPETYIVVSIKDGEIISSDLPAPTDWGAYSVIEKNGKILIRHDIESETTFYSYNKNFKIVEERKILHKYLKAKIEITGEGALYAGSDTGRSFTVNVKGDGKMFEVSCGIWSRWGTLMECSLPLPDGSIQSWEQGCHRFGMLSSSRSGYHEFVCDTNTVIYFNGIKWVSEKK